MTKKASKKCYVKFRNMGQSGFQSHGQEWISPHFVCCIEQFLGLRTVFFQTSEFYLKIMLYQAVTLIF